MRRNAARSIGMKAFIATCWFVICTNKPVSVVKTCYLMARTDNDMGRVAQSTRNPTWTGPEVNAM